AHIRVAPGPDAPARLLPSGDAYYLLQGDERKLLVPDAKRRAELWTTRVWPGALLIGGDIIGTWRRANEKVSIQTWRRLTGPERDVVVAEHRGMHRRTLGAALLVGTLVMVFAMPAHAKGPTRAVIVGPGLTAPV